MTTSRRTMLAALAAAPVTAIPAAMALAASAEPDPIFAAIERHKVAFLAMFEASRALCNEPDNGPNVDRERLARIDYAETEALREEREAVWNLTTIRPTTLSGAIALIGYVEDFNAGKFGLETEDGWRSYAFHWPVDDLPGIEEDHIGRFPYDVLSNVRRALLQIGGAA